MYYIDSHSHLDDDYLFEKIDTVLNNAKKSNVKKIITVLSEPYDKYFLRFEKLLKFENIYGIIGVHPHNAKDYNLDIEKKIIHFVEKHKNKIVAIGEIGLDYYYNFSPKEIQIEVFKRQIKLAEKLNLPIVIHTRNAEEETLKILLEQKLLSSRKVLLHCYTASYEFLKQILKYPDVYFSFSGIITFNKAEDLRKQLKLISISKILIETDSPYLAPVPFRGKKNEPSYVIYTAKKISEVLSIDESVLSEILTKNTLRFFNIKDAKLNQHFVYEYKGNLYINLTTECNLNCPFCVKRNVIFHNYNLFLHDEPEVEEVIDKLKKMNLNDYLEIVFCGFGEPLIRYEKVKKIASYIKKMGYTGTIRVNTNGLAEFFLNKKILEEIADCIDIISISFNATDEKYYVKLVGLNEDFKYYFKQLWEFFFRSIKIFGNKRVVISSIDYKGLDKHKLIQLGEKYNIKVKFRNLVSSQKISDNI